MADWRKVVGDGDKLNEMAYAVFDIAGVSLLRITVAPQSGGGP